MVLGVVAHVDAGKTTLSEALLYETGQIRNLGRVDHQDAYLDNDAQERERGITIFSKQARLVYEEMGITLLDTPGHVDFSAEMERTLQVLDYAVLVISGTDGVQGHTRTLWRLLRHYEIPTFLFVNKMDLDGANREKIQQQLKQLLSDGCVDFSNPGTEEWKEEVAFCKESMLNHFMETGEIEETELAAAISERLLFPCFYGSALKLDGVKELLAGLKKYTCDFSPTEDWSARVFKIGRDARGTRLTYLKVLGGTLRVKDKVTYMEQMEKVDQIRLYSGEKFEVAEEVRAGEVCAVTGLSGTFPGQGLGSCEEQSVPVLEPVLNYRIFLPEDVNPVEMMMKLKQLEEEDPQLHILWNEELREIHAQMMGQVQIEVLTRVIAERFGVTVVFGQGNIVYKETVAKAVEGVGHFEPLRHYAEAHLLLEPGEPGSGIQVFSECGEDVLDLNWQRLIATHVEEREHPGVLTGSALTDVKVTILTGRAHNKHTEGGNFRQATYRAIRQGLKSTECVLLEPFYSFTLEIPVDCVGRAMTDLQSRFAKTDAPEYVSSELGDRAILKGKAPVICLQDYIKEVHHYTKGLGHLSLELTGYDVCHNSEEVIERIGYDSEADTKNPTGSVFCGHGAGFVVPWNEVPDHMHMEFVYREQKEGDTDGYAYATKDRTFGPVVKQTKSVSDYELDKELQEIYAREFGMSKESLEEQERRRFLKKTKSESKASHTKLDKKGNPIYPGKGPVEECLIVDGYNIIFAWSELKELANHNLDSAKDKLKDLLCNYHGYRGGRMIVVFDAYKVKGHAGSLEKYQSLEVVHTKTDETADQYIERMVHNLRSKYRITVATNDQLEQLTILSQGALRMSARGLEEDMKRLEKQEYEKWKESQ